MMVVISKIEDRYAVRIVAPEEEVSFVVKEVRLPWWCIDDDDEIKADITILDGVSVVQFYRESDLAVVLCEPR